VISDTVFRQIIEYLSTKTPSIYRVIKIRVDNIETGVYIYVEVIIEYGNNIFDVLKEFKDKIKKEIEKLTTMNVYQIDITAKGVHMEGDE